MTDMPKLHRRRLTEYTAAEKAIAAADGGGIRERWLWGHRVLRDPSMMSDSGKSLRDGASAHLIRAARAAGAVLSEREIRYRIQCARAYPTEEQFGNAVAEFRTWHDLVAANFSPVERPLDGGTPPDLRTAAQRRHDSARALLGHVGEQGAMFPPDDYDESTPLAELAEYCAQQEAINDRFAAKARQRRAYLDALVDAAGGDTTTTWGQAARLLAGGAGW